MKPTATMISGWAYPLNALQSLAERLNEHLEINLVAPQDVQPMKNVDWLIGWSWGGMVALEQTINNKNSVEKVTDARDRVPPLHDHDRMSQIMEGPNPLGPKLPTFSAATNGLILINSTARFCNTTDYPFGQPASVVRAMQRNISSKPIEVLQDFFARAALPYTPLEITKEIAPSLKNGLDYLFTMDLRDLVKQIEIPALVLHGSEDQIIPLDAGRWLAENMPRAELKICEGLGHDLPARNPEWVAEQIIHFIKTHES